MASSDLKELRRNVTLLRRNADNQTKGLQRAVEELQRDVHRASGQWFSLGRETASHVKAKYDYLKPLVNRGARLASNARNAASIAASLAIAFDSWESPQLRGSLKLRIDQWTERLSVLGEWSIQARELNRDETELAALREEIGQYRKALTDLSAGHAFLEEISGPKTGDLLLILQGLEKRLAEAVPDAIWFRDIEQAIAMMQALSHAPKAQSVDQVVVSIDRLLTEASAWTQNGYMAQDRFDAQRRLRDSLDQNEPRHISKLYSLHEELRNDLLACRSEATLLIQREVRALDAMRLLVSSRGQNANLNRPVVMTGNSQLDYEDEAYQTFESDLRTLKASRAQTEKAAESVLVDLWRQLGRTREELTNRLAQESRQALPKGAGSAWEELNRRLTGLPQSGSVADLADADANLSDIRRSIEDRSAQAVSERKALTDSRDSLSARRGTLRALSQEVSNPPVVTATLPELDTRDIENQNEDLVTVDKELSKSELEYSKLSRALCTRLQNELNAARAILRLNVNNYSALPVALDDLLSSVRQLKSEWKEIERRLMERREQLAAEHERGLATIEDLLKNPALSPEERLVLNGILSEANISTSSDLLVEVSRLQSACARLRENEDERQIQSDELNIRRAGLTTRLQALDFPGNNAAAAGLAVRAKGLVAASPWAQRTAAESKAQYDEVEKIVAVLETHRRRVVSANRHTASKAASVSGG